MRVTKTNELPDIMFHLGPKAQAKFVAEAKRLGMSVGAFCVYAEGQPHGYMERLLGDLVREPGGHEPSGVRK